MPLLRLTTTWTFLAAFLASAVPGQDHALLDDRGGWTPPRPLLDRAVQLRDLGPKEASRFIKKLQHEKSRLRIDVCRAGLRLRDKAAAFACAVHLDWKELDAWEHERIVALCIHDFTRPGTRVDFDRFRSMVGSKEMDAICRGFPPPPWNASPTLYLSQLHRQLRAEHIPALCDVALTRSELRDNALSNLSVILPRTNQHRELVAQAILRWREPATVTAAGLHPLLVELIRRHWLAGRKRTAAWQNRWLYDSVPGPRDAELLLMIVRSDHWMDEHPPVAAIRAMRHLSDAATLDCLQRLVADDDAPDEQILAALAALVARRGATDAARRLAKAAEQHEEALGLWLEVQPKQAVGAFRQWILGASAGRAHKALDLLEDLNDEARSFLHLDLPNSSFEGLEQEAVASGVDGLVLARIGVVVPGCGTSALARAACIRLPGHPEGLKRVRGDDNPYAILNEVLPLLEVAAPRALRRALRSMADLDVARRAVALKTLLKLGDPASGERLLRWATSGQADKDCDAAFGDTLDAAIGWSDGSLDVLLARSRCAAVEVYIREKAARDDDRQAADEALLALAVLEGVPLSLAQSIVAPEWNSLEPAEQSQINRRFRQALLAGKPKAAVAAYLTPVPRDHLIALWRFDTPEVRAYLERARQKRELRLYAFATAQLAAMGDRKAREETLEVMRAGRYRWVDEVFNDEDLATLGHDFKATLPFWIDEMESNCCRRVTACGVLEHAFGLDVELSDGIAEIPADRMRRWWKLHGSGKFGFSRLAGHFVPYQP